MEHFEKLLFAAEVIFKENKEIKVKENTKKISA